MIEESKTGKPISVKNVQNININDRFKKLAAIIMFNKSNSTKERLKEELNLSQDQFETILRKDPTRFTTEVMEGTDKSISTERYYFDNKYLFTIDVCYLDIKTTSNIHVENIIFKEENISNLKPTLIEEKE